MNLKNMESWKCQRLNIRLFVLGVFFIICNSELKAQVFTLEAILEKMNKSNLTLQSYTSKIAALDAYAEGAKSWEAPQISAGLWMTPYNFQKDMGMAMISALQMIPNHAKQNAKQQYMRGMSSVEMENKKYLQNQLIYQVKNNYYNWVLLKKKLTVLKETEALLSYMVQISESNHAYGKSSLASIYKAKAGLAELQNAQLMYEQEIKQKNILMNTLLNQDKNIVFDVDTLLKTKELSLYVTDTANNVTRRSDINAIDQSINLKKLSKALESNKRKPDFGIRYDHMNSFGNQPNLFSIMGMVTLPIAPWSAREYKANLKGMDLEIENLELQKKALINEVGGNLNALVTAIRNKKQITENYQKLILPALNNNYKASLLGYTQNTETLFVVLDALQGWQTARLEHLNNLQELLQMQAEYEKEMEHEY
jgi:cobalt-zinc-cadmium efflux system outer membrane protein